MASSSVHVDKSEARTAEDVYELLKPQTLIFPTDCINMLPDGASPLQECFCPQCIPTLWYHLAPHSKTLAFTMQNDSRTLIEGQQPCLTVYQIVKLVSQMLDPLDVAKLTAIQRVQYNKLQGTFDTLIDDIQSFRGQPGANGTNTPIPPGLNELAKSINQLCFQGLLIDVEYGWEPHRGRYGCTSSDGLHIRISDHFLGAQYAEPSNLHRAQQVLCVLLHEQVHSLFDIYLCAGDCDASSEKRQLCEFLAFATFYMYRGVEYKGQMVNTSVYLCHGPAFQVVARKLADAISRLMGWELALLVGGSHGYCEGVGKQGCWSHCFPDETTQRKNLSRCLKKQIEEVDDGLEKTAMAKEVIEAAKKEAERKKAVAKKRTAMMKSCFERVRKALGGQT